MAALGTGQGVKNLGQAAATASLAVLYTAPAGTGVIISKLIVCNTDTVARTVSVQHNIAAAASAAKQYLYNAFSLAPNETQELLAGITLAATDTISVIASSASVVACNLYGEEFA